MVSIEWSPHSADSTLEDWLAQHRPSDNTTHATNDYGVQEPLEWYYVRSAQTDPGQTLEQRERFKRKSTALRTQLEDECEVIGRTAPLRASKTNGKSQSQLVGELNKVFTKKIYELAQKTSLTSGKWMLFVNQPVIDTIWERLAFAVGDPTGALANSACTAAKVSASTKDAYLICVYVRDAFDLKEVENVFRILKDEAGFLTAYFKADAMTVAGIYSAHVSKCSSTLYTYKDFLPEGEHASYYARSRSSASQSSFPPAPFSSSGAPSTSRTTPSSSAVASSSATSSRSAAIQYTNRQERVYAIGAIRSRPVALEILEADLLPLSDEEEMVPVKRKRLVV